MFKDPNLIRLITAFLYVLREAIAAWRDGMK